jgi:hypothetical protein
MRVQDLRGARAAGTLAAQIPRRRLAPVHADPALDDGGHRGCVAADRPERLPVGPCSESADYPVFLPRITRHLSVSGGLRLYNMRASLR